MSFLKLSSAAAQIVPEKIELDDKSQDVPANDEPKVQPEKKPAEDTPDSKE